MSNIYKGVDLANALAHYGRKGMRRGRHLTGTTWWQKSLGRKSGASTTSDGIGYDVKKVLDDFKIKKEAADEIKREKDEKKKIEDLKWKMQDPFKRKDSGFAKDFKDAVELKIKGAKHKRWRVIQEKVKQQKEEERKKKLKEMQRKFNPWK